MATKTVDAYEKLIKTGKKKEIYSESVFFDALRHTLMTVARKPDPNMRLFNGIELALRQYIHDDRIQENRCFGKARKHSREVAEMITAIKSRDAYPDLMPIKDMIQKVIPILERGVLECSCNLQGNFANLCRAIVNQSRGFRGWDFSEKFTDRLGLEPTVVSPCFRPQAW